MQDRRQRRAFAAEIALLGFVVACGPGGADRPTDGRDRGPAAGEVAAPGSVRTPASTPPGEASSPGPEAPASAGADAAGEAAAKRQVEAPPGGAHASAVAERSAGAVKPAELAEPAEPAAIAEPAGVADDRADRLADLELLCAALRRDYVDGTLTDYYGGLAPRTAFGQELRRRGEASMTPGRLLEAALRDMAKRPGDPTTPACDALVGELDELE